MSCRHLCGRISPEYYWAGATGAGFGAGATSGAGVCSCVVVVCVLVVGTGPALNNIQPTSATKTIAPTVISVFTVLSMTKPFSYAILGRADPRKVMEK
jgi:hypothetical protein